MIGYSTVRIRGVTLFKTTDWHDVAVKIYGAIPTITAYIDNYPEITVKDVTGQSI